MNVKMNTKTILIVLSLLAPILMPFFQGCDPKGCDLPAPTNLASDKVAIDSFLITWDRVVNSQAVDYQIIFEDITNQDTIVNQITNNTFYGVKVTRGDYFRVTVAARCALGQTSRNTIQIEFRELTTFIIADEVVMMPGPSGVEDWYNCNICASSSTGTTISSYDTETEEIEIVPEPEEENLVRVYAHRIEVPSLGYEFILKTAVSRNCNKIRAFTNRCLASRGLNIVPSQGIDDDGDDILLIGLSITGEISPVVVIIFQSHSNNIDGSWTRTFSIYTDGGELLNVTSEICPAEDRIDWEMPCEAPAP